MSREEAIRLGRSNEPSDPDFSYSPRYTPGVLPSNINADSLARPFLPWQILTSYKLPARDRAIVERLQRAEKLVGRPLTSEEQSGLAEHTALGFAVASHGLPITAAWVAWRFYVTRDRLKLPPFGNMIRPNGEPRKNLPYWNGKELKWGRANLLGWVPTAHKLGVLNFLRASSYFGAGYVLLIRPFVVAWASLEMARLDSQDDRLRAVMRAQAQEHKEEQKDSQRRVEEWRKQKLLPPLPSRARGTQDEPIDGQDEVVRRDRRDPTGQGPRGAADWWGSYQKKITKPSSSELEPYDASPTGGLGMFEEFFEDEDQRSPLPESPTNSEGNSSEENSDSTRWKQEVASTTRHEQKRQPRNASSEHSDGMADDSDPGGDAWEQIRQGGQTNPTISRRRKGIQPQQDRGAEAAYSISSKDEEKSYARSEAQKEFDDRVEQERRAGDFDSGHGKRW